MNLDDKSLFLDAMEDVQPLKRNNDVHWHPGRNSRAPQRVDTLQLDNFLTTGYLDIVPLATPLEFKREGLQSGVLDKLRRGKYSQQASLSLLRQPVEQCRQMLFAFMVQAQKEGLRNVLIVHGKGRDDQSHAQYYPQLSGALAGRAAGGAGLLRRASASWRQRRLLCCAA
ncbi:Smr/MutS family protein [Klebsiella pneumoniae]